MKIRQHISLILGLSIPVAMMLFVALSIYLPRLWMNPRYDFLYAASDNYYAESYAVMNGRLIRASSGVSGSALAATVERTPLLPPGLEGRDGPPLYVYDVTKDERRPISFAEARRLRLDPAEVSPDGYEVASGGSSGGLFLLGSGSSYDDIYLKGRGGSKKLNLRITGSGYSRYNFEFTGWVLKE